MTNQEKSLVDNFHQYLEEIAAKNLFVRVHYYSDLQELLKTTQVVKRISPHNGRQHLVLANGDEIPMDKLIRVGDRLAPGHDPDDAYSCEC